MTSILLKYGAGAAATAIVLMAVVAFALFGPSAALGALVGGGLAGLNFVGLIYVVGQIFDSQVPDKKKLTLGLLLMGKLALIGGGFYVALVTYALSPLGVSLGIGASIFGLIFGLHKATTSTAGLAAMQVEETRIEQDLGDESDDDLGP